ncbi:hypothetical protein [Amycolatopsis sp. lyj-109]|uniref:hypothetical protein n=1 Tax=Amycolatopsis sp. lyj-109 TaxID=2789287 RepID=UPI003979FCCE
MTTRIEAAARLTSLKPLEVATPTVPVSAAVTDLATHVAHAADRTAQRAIDFARHAHFQVLGYTGHGAPATAEANLADLTASALTELRIA